MKTHSKRLTTLLTAVFGLSAAFFMTSGWATLSNVSTSTVSDTKKIAKNYLGNKIGKGEKTVSGKIKAKGKKAESTAVQAGKSAREKAEQEAKESRQKAEQLQKNLQKKEKQTKKYQHKVIKKVTD